MTGAARAAEIAARASYGKLLAILSQRSGDIAAAEDALADAFAAALSTWPERGVPATPDAWLLTAARNRLTDTQRRAARMDVTDDVPEMAETSPEPGRLPDRRLALMCVCTHPAIATEMHTPLILQCVLGLEAQQIARAFLDSPTALAQRLVRAKRKIRDAGIPFVVPGTALPDRMDAIYEAIYAVHALDWIDPSDDLGHEAMFLADTLARLRADDPEARGLAALIAMTHARRDARVADGCLVPVPEQDTSLWDHGLNRYALRHLSIAQAQRRPGRFQIEAAIQAVHVHRHETGRTDWQALLALYDGLWSFSKTRGVAVARTAVISHLESPASALAMLDRIQDLAAFQPACSLRADLLARMGETAEASAAYDKAISLTVEPVLRSYLDRRKAALEQ